MTYRRHYTENKTENEAIILRARIPHSNKSPLKLLRRI